jgi:uncharacterized membrane protein
VSSEFSDLQPANRAHGAHGAHVARHLRRLRIRAYRDRLRESLLFVPAAMLAGAIVIAVVLGAVDDAHRSWVIPGNFSFDPGTASTLLSTIAGATITTAGVVFSLLVVSLQLASGQFSPRVLRGFWRDQFGQVLIGLLLSTFAFSVIALARLNPKAQRAPALTMTFTLLLTLASVVFIVVYLDRISRRQYVGNIVERVAAEALQLVGELPYGPHVGMRAGEPVPAPAPEGEAFVVRSQSDGWVQQISRRAVIAGAPPGGVIRLETRVGGYLQRDTPVASIWPRPADPAAAERLIHAAVILGPARTMQQDIDFGLRQLNDIALRALSPAVNDPTTAIEVTVRIGSVMRPLVLAELPAQSVRDAHGRTLLTPFDLDHAEYIGHAFDQLRLYAAEHPQVLTAIARTLRMLRGACQLADSRPDIVAVLDRHLALTVACCAPGMHPEDRARVQAAASVLCYAAGWCGLRGEQFRRHVHRCPGDRRQVDRVAGPRVHDRPAGQHHLGVEDPVGAAGDVDLAHPRAASREQRRRELVGHRPRKLGPLQAEGQRDRLGVPNGDVQTARTRGLGEFDSEALPAPGALVADSRDPADRHRNHVSPPARFIVVTPNVRVVPRRSHAPTGPVRSPPTHPLGSPWLDHLIEALPTWLHSPLRPAGWSSLVRRLLLGFAGRPP